VATDVEVERALEAITATLNDHRVGTFDRDHVQELVSGALAGELKLTVDDGGGIHDEGGARIGAVRKTPSGEWIADRQNPEALHSDVAVPAASKGGGKLADRLRFWR
jgi:hypothetical protein